MIDLRNNFIAPVGFMNPTIPKGIVKIPIINLTPTKKIEVPFKILSCPKKTDIGKRKYNRSQYMLLNLIFNQLTNVI